MCQTLALYLPWDKAIHPYGVGISGTQQGRLEWRAGSASPFVPTVFLCPENLRANLRFEDIEGKDYLLGHWFLVRQKTRLEMFAGPRGAYPPSGPSMARMGTSPTFLSQLVPEKSGQVSG